MFNSSIKWFETLQFGGALCFSTNDIAVKHFLRIFFTTPFLKSLFTANLNPHELCRL